MKKMFGIISISLCIIIIFYTSCSFAADIDVTRAKVDIQYGKIVKIIGYLVILIFAVKDILSELQKGDIKAVLTIFIKYIIIYAALLFLPVSLRWVEDFVEGLK